MTEYNEPKIEILNPHFRRRSPRTHSTWLALLLLWLSGGAAARAEEPALVVFAAASLTTVLEEIDASYTRSTQQAVTPSFAASSALARQLESGAKADVFVSADIEWMDYVQQRDLIERATRRDL